MSLAQRIRTNTILKTLAQSAEKRLKRRLTSLLWRLLRAPEATAIDELGDVRRILLIRPNYRIGNALISTPAIDAFRSRFPDARLDLLATDKTRGLFDHLPVDHCHTMTRRAILRPWLLVTLLARLRRERYDLAVQLVPGSLTGAICTRLIGAQTTMGRAKPEQRWFDIEVEGATPHAYDAPRPFAHALGVACRNRPRLHLSHDEQARAEATLAHCLPAVEPASVKPDTAGVTPTCEPFVAVFIGGHLDKRLPWAQWFDILNALEAANQRHLVCLGPEEADLAPTISHHLEGSRFGALCPPQPLRDFAALVARSGVLISPDSGPLHLAAALEVPTIALMQVKKSQKFVPREPHDQALWRPTAEEVVQAVTRLDLFRRTYIKAVVTASPSAVWRPMTGTPRDSAMASKRRLGSMSGLTRRTARA
ncbi:heptosyltransferase-3 [Onishia taeanensis]|uniref:Heptosyltransferase-3 n=1 Tax=Onishia taeanensis TaxID=284577 RepID=A0A328Y4D7_9GAMM|nr:heptosyltransferase-3 [Halomonas taeanensis]